MSDTPDGAFSINQSDLPQSNIAAFNQVAGNLTQNQTVHVYAGAPLTETLQQILYHHESATIFANRLEGFVGRAAEIAEIRQHIAQVMPSGGYVTITAQAGEGKSSVIASMVSQDGPDQTAFHFIALTPGRDYQLSLLRPIVARLILKHGLSTTYFPDESYPAMRDYFHLILRQLSERGIQEVLYLDGLDQLKRETDGDRDLSFLPTTLPTGIVIVLGTRPDDTLQPLQTMKSSEYRLPHLNYLDFKQLLVQHRVMTPAAQRLYNALQGNAFYLVLVVQELKAGPIADLEAFIQRISDNPENLFGLTIDRLCRQNRTLWKEVLQPTLGLLLVVQEPFGIAPMRFLLGVEDIDLRMGLQRLGGLVAQDSQGRFFLYHLKVRDYLLEDVDDSEKPFVVSHDQIVALHGRLAVWCGGDTGDIKRIWEDTTGLEQTRRWYARHHYIVHLALSGQWEQLSQVINDGIYGQNKQQFDPSTQLYALDLDHARTMAAHYADLGNLWKWTLLRVSITSQMDTWPADLFLALVYLGRQHESLRRIELLSDKMVKIRMFCRLSSLLDKEDSQFVWSRVQVVAAGIQDMDLRAEALRDVAVAQAKVGLWEEADTTAIGINHVAHYAEALRDIGVAQAQAGLWDAAYTTIIKISDRPWRAEALSILAQVQAQTRPDEALRIFALVQNVITQIGSISLRAEALHCLAVAQAQAGLWDAAHNTIMRIRDEGLRSKALCRLTAVQAEARLWQIAVTTVTEISREAWKGAAMSAIVEAQAKAELWKEAYTTIAGIQDMTWRAVSLSILAQAQAQAHYANAASTFESALSASMHSVTKERRMEVLHDITIAQGQAGLWEAAYSTLETINDAEVYTKTLSALAVHQIQIGHYQGVTTLAQARKSAKRIIAPRQQIFILCNIGMVQSHVLLTQAITTFTLAQQIADTSEVADGTQFRGDIAVAQARAGLWNEAHNTVMIIREDKQRAHVISSLVGLQAHAGLWEDVHTTFKEIGDDHEKAEALRSIARAQAEAGWWKEARITLADIDESRVYLEALYDIAVAEAKAGLWQAAYTTIKQINDNNLYLEAMIALVEAQSQAGQWELAYDTVEQIDDVRGLIKALSNLATAQSLANNDGAKATFDLAFDEAMSIKEVWNRQEAIRDIAVAQAHSGLWVKANWTMNRLDSETRRVDVMNALIVAQARVGLWDMAWETARKIVDPWKYSGTIDALRTLLSCNINMQTRQKVAEFWYAARTTSELLNRYSIALPFIPTDPLLGLAMTTSFSWVDMQLKDN
jgi:tetratricopeptide (TPR) repeat protein